MRPNTTPDRPKSRRSASLAALATFVGVLLLCNAATAVTKVWARTVNGSADSSDGGQEVVMAPNGDIYVVGSITVTAEGANIWIRKYNSAGTKLWTRTVNGSADGGDYAFGAAVDGSGNLYVVGQILTPAASGGANIWIRKYTSTGAKIWTRTVDGPGGEFDTAYGTATDAAGNVYVVGAVTPSAGGYRDIWIRKYSSSGAKKWTRTVNGTAVNASDNGRDAAVDANGNVYVVGGIQMTGEETNIWLRKYSSTGAKLWTRSFDSPTSGWDEARRAALDGDGNVYVVGHISTSSEGNNIWLRKYDSTGGKRWTRTIDGPGTDMEDSDFGLAVAVDGNDAAYIIGQRGDIGSAPAVIRKYSSAGVKRWTAAYSGPQDQAYGFGITVNTTGRVYATGQFANNPQGYDIFIRKYRQ